jgi:hypothetical protein
MVTTALKRYVGFAVEFSDAIRNLIPSIFHMNEHFFVALSVAPLMMELLLNAIFKRKPTKSQANNG